MHQGVPNQQLVSPGGTMGPQKANALLLSMLGQLPPKRWWVMLEKSPHDVGLSKAFSIPRVDIEALIIKSNTWYHLGPPWDPTLTDSYNSLSY